MLVMLANAVGSVFLTNTVGGRHVFAVGGNMEASRFSGVPIGRVKIRVYVLSGLTAGIAAFMGASFYGSASCADATGYELYVIASAVVGGASLLGGKGSAVSALLGAVLIVLIRQSIRTLHFDQNYEWIMIGCAIIIAVVLDQASAGFDGRRLAARGEAIRESISGSIARQTHELLRRSHVAVSRLLRGLETGGETGEAQEPANGLKIAMIAKSSTNPVFLSARTGAEAAAKELSAKNNVPVEIVWMTPPTEDGQVQAQRIAQAVNEGREGGADFVLRRGQGHRRHQRRRGARSRGHDVRQRCPRVEAVRLLWRRRREDRRGGDGRTGEADGREGIDRHPCRQSERARIFGSGWTA